jgi:hypothetical protein
MEDRRDLDLAPPVRGPAAAAAAPPEAELGGPGTARDPAQRDTQNAPPGAAAAGHRRHDAALAPRHRPAPLGRQIHARQDRPAGRRPAETSKPWSSGWPGRTPNGATAGSTGNWPGWESRSRRRLYGRSSRPTGSTPRRDGSDRPGRSSCAPRPRRSWPATSQRRPARRHPDLRPGRDGARDPARPHPRRHPAPDRGMDHAAGPQPAYGPRRTGRPDEVHDPRPGIELHRRVRRGPRRRRDQGRALQRPDARTRSPNAGSGDAAASC